MCDPPIEDPDQDVEELFDLIRLFAVSNDLLVDHFHLTEGVVDDVIRYYRRQNIVARVRLLKFCLEFGRAIDQKKQKVKETDGN